MKVKEKYKDLLGNIRRYDKAAIAFSGGVDSTLLAYAASEALGIENVVCFTARALSFPARELKEAEAFCEERGIAHEIFDFNEIGIEGFAANPPDRCYLCKRALFSEFNALAERRGLKVLLEGSNADDEGDYRPGIRAIREMDVKSPLYDADLKKEDVREILKSIGLTVWEKPSYACLATRFPYGEEITIEKLGMVEKAEQFLFDKGYKNTRIRIHGKDNFTARIEVPAKEITELVKEPLRSETEKYFKELGFAYVALDLTGYRMGSMNEVLSGKRKG